ncbi:MAG TPA: nucleotidyltransferase [Clostridiales bacterium]|nr:nucleotidyltransferase [Clostridiales bacterium]
MKTAMIIAEYNPFHLGHAWQLQTIRQQLGSDCAVMIIMSGNFTQRGEPAVLDKWSRTRMALSGGADLVVELPFAYAAASAERFASGGVLLAYASGLEGHLVFGSECGDLGPLNQLAELLSEETPEYRRLLHEQLDLGESFPAARQSAVAGLTGQSDLAGLLASSNNILAVEYLKALRHLPCSRLIPLTLPRQGQAYLDNQAGGQGSGFASASAIRLCLDQHFAAPVPDWAGLIKNLSAMMPSAALAILLEKIQSGPGPLNPESLAGPIIGLLRSRQIEEIEQYPGMGEGLGRRLAAAARRPQTAPEKGSGRLAGLLADAATRRFPQTRIQRALLVLLAGLRAEDLTLFDAAGGPQYLRILGFNRRGRYLLKLMRKLAERPVIMNASDFLEYKDPALTRLADLDLLATDQWMLAAGKTCGRDFDTPVVMG